MDKSLRENKTSNFLFKNLNKLKRDKNSSWKIKMTKKKKYEQILTLIFVLIVIIVILTRFDFYNLLPIILKVGLKNKFRF